MPVEKFFSFVSLKSLTCAESDEHINEIKNQ